MVIYCKNAKGVNLQRSAESRVNEVCNKARDFRNKWVVPKKKSK